MILGVLTANAFVVSVWMLGKRNQPSEPFSFSWVGYEVILAILEVFFFKNNESVKVMTEHENTAFLFSRFIRTLLTLMFLGNSRGEIFFLLLQFLFFFHLHVL